MESLEIDIIPIKVIFPQEYVEMTSKMRINIPWLKSPKWRHFPMTKGLGHHRIPLGIILAPNEDITFTIENGNLNYVQVRLLNNDNTTEKSAIIYNTSDKEALNIEHVSVPFIDCQYLEEIPTENPVVCVDYPPNSKLLPIFRYGDDEDSFFELWDSQAAEYAYIESNYFALLIPEIDKEHARYLPFNKHLDDIIIFYDEIFSIYSGLIGLSFEDTGTNQNVRNRFFLKADKSGYGSAYYCDAYTAESTASVKSFWLDISPTNWGALHEIGHGHELTCLCDETFSTSEVWNNILVSFYQYIMMGGEIVTKGGLSRESTEIHQHLMRGKSVKEWGLFQKLSFLLHMFFKTGPQAFSRFNQLIRQECAGNPHYASGSTTLEKIMHLFAVEFNLDVYPFMRLANAVISDEQLQQHYYSLTEVAYPLNYLINNVELLRELKKMLQLFYYTSLVTPFDLRKFNLKRDFTIDIEDTTFDIIFGETLRLMDGPRTIAERRIVSKTITLRNIPIGVYKIFISSNSSNVKYVYDDIYAIVHLDLSNTLTLTGRKLVRSSLFNDKIMFLGLGDNNFATLSVDPLKNIISFHFFSENPHSYFPGETYSSITITNNLNKIIFSKVIKGMDSSLGLYEIPMEQLVTVEIFHTETRDRLKSEDPLLCPVINRETNTNVFYASKFGFHKEDTPKSSLAERLFKRIDKAANKIRSIPYLVSREFCYPKYDFYLAIEAFKDLFGDLPLSLNIDGMYKDCLPPGISTDFVDALIEERTGHTIREVNTDDSFYEIVQTNNNRKLILSTNHNRSSSLFGNIKFLGLSDKHCATLYINTVKSVIKFHVLSSNPHSHFHEEAYFGVIVRNNEAEVLFSKTINGIDSTQEEFEIPLLHYCEIEIFHAETTDRLTTESTVMGYLIDRDSTVNTFVISNQDLLMKPWNNNLPDKSLLKETSKIIRTGSLDRFIDTDRSEEF